jgi:single-strand DNA-binding protein
MSATMNKVFLIGFCGQDAEIKTTNGGTKYGRFSVATKKSWQDKNKEWQEETQWHNCVAWGGLVESVEKVVGKGKYVFVEGEVKYNKWEDDQGQTRTSTQIVCQRVKSLERKASKVEDQPKEASSAPEFDASEEIPF